MQGKDQQRVQQVNLKKESKKNKSSSVRKPPRAFVEKFDSPITSRIDYGGYGHKSEIYCGLCERRAYYKVSHEMEHIIKVDYYCKSCFTRVKSN